MRGNVPPPPLTPRPPWTPARRPPTTHSPTSARVCPVGGVSGQQPRSWAVARARDGSRFPARAAHLHSPHPQCCYGGGYSGHPPPLLGSAAPLSPSPPRLPSRSRCRSRLPPPRLHRPDTGGGYGCATGVGRRNPTPAGCAPVAVSITPTPAAIPPPRPPFPPPSRPAPLVNNHPALPFLGPPRGRLRRLPSGRRGRAPLPLFFPRSPPPPPPSPTVCPATQPNRT